jgi:signal transduction histidine kinase
MSKKYKFKPSSRIITTIGEDLIKDMNSAIIELVKNSYDADATKVDIKISSFEENKNEKLKIEIIDNGHGMSFETVINKWMVPATADKLDRKYSPGGRMLQGRKGIGRYAVAKLGEVINLRTISKSGEKTTLSIDWRDFNKYEYLEDVDIDIFNEKTNLSSETNIEIIGSTEKLYEWTEEKIDLLIKELSKLLSPIRSNSSMSEKDKFDINIIFNNFIFDNYSNRKINISPIPLIDLYDYRIYGKISKNGKIDLTYENKITSNSQEEEINYIIEDINKNDFCAEVRYDIRAFDRDPQAIDDLIGRGLKDSETGQFMGKREARNLLNSLSGISIYRGDFRVRPYGSPGYDWLELDKKRVQNPSMRIGNNQVVGFVKIEKEEESHLEEKSARDGLKENKYFEALKKSIIEVINELEIRRFEFRKKSGRGRNSKSISEELNNLFDFDDLSKNVDEILKSKNVEEDVIYEINDYIEKTQDYKTKILKDIKETISLYQGQITLGKIIMVILHEGRKPINWFKSQKKTLVYMAEKFRNENDNEELLNKIIDRINRSGEYAEMLVNLFKRLEPLSIKKRRRKTKFNLYSFFNEINDLFEAELKKSKIKFILKGNNKTIVKSFKQDFFIVFTNLFENSIYWLNISKSEDKKITVYISEDDSKIYIDFNDNGSGIKEEYIVNENLFEPGFTLKENGTGLGLSIAGEAIERNNGQLKAISNKNGAYFRVEIDKKDEVNG